MKFPKPVRQKSVEYLRAIRKMPCLISDSSCLGQIDADHLMPRGSGGSDFFAIPLCRLHHSERHMLGTQVFQERHDINLWCQVARLVLHRLTELESELTINEATK